MDPTTQGQPQAGAESQPDKTEQHEGFQKRIDELTSSYRETQRMLAQRDEQMAQLLALQANQAASQVSPEKMPDIEPERRAEVEAIVSPILKRMEGMMSRLEQGLTSTQVEAKRAGLPPEVATRVDQLVSAWQRQGVLNKVATLDDAVRMAYGEFAMKRDAENTANKAKQAFNGNGQSVLVQNAAPNAAPASKGHPTDLGSRSIDQQVAYWESTGVGDMPM